MDEQRKLVERALAYPFATSPTSFVLCGEEARALAAPAAAIEGRTALLAYGSNAAPAALARKLGDSTLAAPVPVLRASLAGFDVVYSAHVSLYGSIPAALQRSPGTEVCVSVAYLTSHQLRLVQRTEPNYELVSLAGDPCSLESGDGPAGLQAFLSRHGCLALDGSEVALAAISARGRRFPALSQREMLARVRDELSPALSLEQFVAGGATDPDLAARRTRALAGSSTPQLRSPG